MNIERIEKLFHVNADNKFSESKKGMTSFAFPDATKVGVERLKKGDNAVDVAYAIKLALDVYDLPASGVGDQSITIINFYRKAICIYDSTRTHSLAIPSKFRNIQDGFIG
ncbi:MAG: hypothetical protein OEL81_01855 [Nitrosopumilus sp.]|nr:hypothetical protein [Nitrosopumilus sp.]